MITAKRAKYLGLLGAMVVAIGAAALPERAIAQTASDSAAPGQPLVQNATPDPGTEISETKRSLIYQLLEMTGGRAQHEQAQQIMFTQVQQQMQGMMGQLMGGADGASSPLAVEEASAAFDAFISEFSEAVQTEITYDDYLERVYYPVYDQHLTEEDLRGLISFYETPLGERLIAVQPQILQDSMARTAELFTPQMIEIASRILQQQLGQVQGEADAPQ